MKLNKDLRNHFPNTIKFFEENHYFSKSSKGITNTFNDEITRLSSHYKYMQLYLAVLDAIKCRLDFLIPPKSQGNLRKISAT